MANYRSYRQVRSDQIAAGSISSAKLQKRVWLLDIALNIYMVIHVIVHLAVVVFGQFPSGVEKITFELWGAGGNGHGACSCNRCQHYQGAAGGTYNTKTISTTGGCQYRVCAGGVYRCCSREL